MEELISVLAGAIISSLVAYFLPLLTQRIKFNSNENLTGLWTSTYEDIEDVNKDDWVNERLEISFNLFGVVIQNSQSDHNYDYRGKCKIKGQYLVGEWSSRKPGANAQGRFLLVIGPQGDLMYGYWSGSDSTGAKRFGKWALSRNEDKIKEAKDLSIRMGAFRIKL